MVARPTTTPSFATGGSRRLEPEAGEKSNGFREGYRFAPRKANWALGYAVDWVAWLAALLDSNEEHTYQTPKTRKKVVSLFAAQVFDGDSGTAADWSRAGNPATEYWWLSVGAQKPLIFPLSDYLRNGQELDTIKIIVDPVAANAATGDRMYAALITVDPNFGTPAAPTPVVAFYATDDGTDAAQTITITCDLAIVTDGDTAKDYFLLILSANEVGGDKVHGVELAITDPGPRNV
jgi:hypothetical protein